MSEEVALKLAALIYYQTKKGEDPKAKPQSFEKLPDDDRKKFISEAQNLLDHFDRLNLEVVPKVEKKKKEEADQELHAKVRRVVSEFFGQITVWKKQHIPQDELCLRIVRAVNEGKVA